MSVDPTVEDFFLATAQALGLDPRLRREGMEKIARAADPCSPPWDAADGCFGHCDPEGWHRPCRDHENGSSDER